MKMAQCSPMRQIRVHVETEITDEERVKIEECLPFKKVDQRKLKDVTKKVNAVIKNIERDYITQTNKLAMAAALWFAKEVGVKKGKRGEKKAMVEEKN